VNFMNGTLRTATDRTKNRRRRRTGLVRPREPYVCQTLPQWPQRVGSRPTRSASKPIGKKQIATTIAQIG
jgi:hypothetical protein